MKKIAAILALTALCTIGATTAFAGLTPGTGVNGSMHDITYMSVAHPGAYGQDEFQRVCIFCHTPHNAMTTNETIEYAPLWNHAVTSITPAPYTWAAPANVPITINDPLVGPTRLCLGCHDGVTAVAQHGPLTNIGGPGSGMNNNNPNSQMSGQRVVNDFSITHPVGFSYSLAMTTRNSTTVGVKKELVDPNLQFIDRVLQGADAVNNDTNLGARTGWTYTGKQISDVLYGAQQIMTCASCHEVHNYKNAVNDLSVDATGTPQTFRPNYFVWAREQGSALCLSCHYK